MMLEVLRSLSIGALSTGSASFQSIVEKETVSRGVSRHDIEETLLHLYAFKYAARSPK